MLGHSPAGKPQSTFQSQSAIIEALLAYHEGKQGMSKRTLENKFADANQCFLEQTNSFEQGQLETILVDAKRSLSAT